MKKIRKEEYRLILLIVIGLIILIGFIHFTNSEGLNNKININLSKNIVTLNSSINSTDSVYFSSPYIVTNIGYTEYEIESKYNLVDIIFVIDSKDISFKNPEIYNPKLINYVTSYTCEDKSPKINKNIFTCIYPNSSLEFEREFEYNKSNTFYWNESYLKEWESLSFNKEITDISTKELTNLNNQYVVRTNLKNGKNKIRVYIDIPRNGFNLKKVDTEYWIIVKPIGISLDKSISNKYYIDPFINTSGDKKNLDFLNTSLISAYNFDEASGSIIDVKTGKYNNTIIEPNVVQGNLTAISGTSIYFYADENHYFLLNESVTNANNMPNNNFTIIVWFKWIPAQGDSAAQRVWSVSSTENDLSMTTSTGAMYVLSKTNALLTNQTLPTNVWTMLTFVCENGTLHRAFMNNTEMFVNNTNACQRPSSALRFASEATGNRNTGGNYDNLMIFNVSLNYSTIADFYNYQIMWNTTANAEGGADITPPYFTTIPATTEINYTQGFGVLFNATDISSNPVNYSINWTTLFTINQSGYLTNSTKNLAVGIYKINVSINDSVNNINSTIYIVNISKATSVNCGVLVNPAMTANYPTANRFQTINPGDPGDADITLYLYRDDIGVSNPDNTILGVGVYTYIGNMTGGQNWTDKAVCGGSSFTVNRGTTVLNLFLNGTESDFEAEKYNLNVTCFANNIQGNINLSRNGTEISFGISPKNITELLTEGVYNYTCEYPITENYSRTIVSYTANLSDTSGPIIVFLNQTPSNITSDNIYTSKLNVSYNITDISGINVSSVTYYSKTNSSTSEIWQYINGTQTIVGYLGLNGRVGVNMTNVSSIWDFTISSTLIYPSVFNLDPEVTGLERHDFYLLDSSNKYLKIRFYNLTNNSYGTFNFMANSTIGASDLQIYFCNSSYLTGVVRTSPNCIIIANFPSTQTFNYSVSAYAKYNFVPFNMNVTSGILNGIKVTNVNYLVLRGTSLGDWYVYYVSNISRSDTCRYTANSGNVWSNFNGTIDTFISQYTPLNYTNYYYVCANDSLGNRNCSSVRSNAILEENLTPSVPNVYSPINSTYSGNININYTSSESPVGIIFYNISLMTDGTGGAFNKTIISNNSLNLSYVWNSLSTPNGNYMIRVMVTDYNGLSSYGYSEEFEINNTLPSGTSPSVGTGNTESYLIPNISLSENITNITNIISNETLGNEIVVKKNSNIYLLIIQIILLMFIILTMIIESYIKNKNYKIDLMSVSSFSILILIFSSIMLYLKYIKTSIISLIVSGIITFVTILLIIDLRKK